MAAGSQKKGFDIRVSLVCSCGRSHRLSRDAVLTGLGVKRRKCVGCGARFVIACNPGDGKKPDEFWPLFLEQVPPLGDTQAVGIVVDGSGEVPSKLHFQCRCGCRLVGKQSGYGRPMRCPKCSTRMVVRPGYDAATGDPVPVVEYPKPARKADAQAKRRTGKIPPAKS